MSTFCHSVCAAVLMLGAANAIAQPESYTIQPGHTYPSFEAPHQGISLWRGKFNRSEGKVVLDRAARTGTVDIVVDITSIDFGHDKMNERALSDMYFSADKFPKATYTGKINFTGDTPSSVDGQLTLLGVSKDLRLKIHSFKCINRNGSEMCGADAEADFDRSIFGMTRDTDNGGGATKLRIQVEARKD